LQDGLLEAAAKAEAAQMKSNKALALEKAAKKEQRDAERRAAAKEDAAQQWHWVLAKVSPKNRRWLQSLAAHPPKKSGYDNGW